MIIKGELGNYEVVWAADAIKDAYVHIYREGLTKKICFGLIEIDNKPDYTTYGVSSITNRINEYTAQRMLPDQLESWFKRAVHEFDLFDKAWAAQ